MRSRKKTTIFVDASMGCFESSREYGFTTTTHHTNSHSVFIFIVTTYIHFDKISCSYVCVSSGVVSYTLHGIHICNIHTSTATHTWVRWVLRVEEFLVFVNDNLLSSFIVYFVRDKMYFVQDIVVCFHITKLYGKHDKYKLETRKRVYTRIFLKKKTSF